MTGFYFVPQENARHVSLGNVVDIRGDGLFEGVSGCGKLLWERESLGSGYMAKTLRKP
jgi:hypothetical protein